MSKCGPNRGPRYPLWKCPYLLAPASVTQALLLYGPAAHLVLITISFPRSWAKQPTDAGSEIHRASVEERDRQEPARNPKTPSCSSLVTFGGQLNESVAREDVPPWTAAVAAVSTKVAVAETRPSASPSPRPSPPCRVLPPSLPFRSIPRKPTTILSSCLLSCRIVYTKIFVLLS